MYTQEDIQGMLSQYQQSGSNLNYMPQNLPSLEEMQAAGAAYQQQQIAQQQAQAEAVALQAQQQAQAEAVALQAQQAQNEALLAQGITPLTNAFDPYSVAEDAKNSVQYSANDLGLDVRPENTAGIYMPNRPVGGTEADLNEWSDYYNNTPEAYALMSTDEKSDLLYWNFLEGKVSQDEFQEQSKALRIGAGFDDRYMSIPDSENYRWEWQSGGAIGAEEDFFNSPEIQAYADEFGREAAIEKYFKGEGLGLNNAQLWNINQDKVGGFNVKKDLPGGSVFQDEVMGTVGGQMLLGLALGPLAGKLLTGVGGMTAGTLGTQMATGALTSAGLTAASGGGIDDILKAAAGGGFGGMISAGVADFLPQGVQEFLANDGFIAGAANSTIDSAVQQVLMTGELDIGDAIKSGLINQAQAEVIDFVKTEIENMGQNSAPVVDGNLVYDVETGLGVDTPEIDLNIDYNNLLDDDPFGLGSEYGNVDYDSTGNVIDNPTQGTVLYDPDGNIRGVQGYEDLNIDYEGAAAVDDVAVMEYDKEGNLVYNVPDGTVVYNADGSIKGVKGDEDLNIDYGSIENAEDPFDLGEEYGWLNYDKDGNIIHNAEDGTVIYDKDGNIKEVVNNTTNTTTDGPPPADDPTPTGGDDNVVDIPSVVGDPPPSTSDTPITDGLLGGLGGGGNEPNLLKMFKMPWLRRLDPMGPLLSQNAPALQNLSQVYRGPI